VLGGQRLAGRFAFGERNGKLDTQARSGSVGAVHNDVAAQRLYPVLEAEKACSGGEVGTSYAVVTHL
jgi:hypothetical protein